MVEPERNTGIKRTAEIGRLLPLTLPPLMRWALAAHLRCATRQAHARVRQEGSPLARGEGLYRRAPSPRLRGEGRGEEQSPSDPVEEPDVSALKRLLFVYMRDDARDGR